MDKTKALAIEKSIQGKLMAGYTVLNFIDNGKSAAVFKAKQNDTLFALKIFDNDMVERFGHEIQNRRIEQEIALKNHEIPNLVKIFDGGTTTVEGQDYYFIVMEFISGENLKSFIENKTYDEKFIKSTLKTLLETTNELLIKKHIAHRDIKPENIMVDSAGKIILMDLGVLKLVGAKSFSDEEEKQFVGTLRYAPPEFLMRNEEDSQQGWKAVNLYQIGATIHDLIMRKALFFDKKPYSNLVIAIKDDVPIISNSVITFKLQQVARNMLTKDWKKRLSISKDDEIFSVCSENDLSNNQLENGIDEILKSRLEHQAKFDEIEKLRKNKIEIQKNQKEVAQKLHTLTINCLNDLQSKGVFVKYNKADNFRFDSDLHSSTNELKQNFLFELIGDLRMGFPRNLFLLVRISNNEESFTEIDMLGIFPYNVMKPDISNPQNFFHEILFGRQNSGHNRYNRNTQNTHFKTTANLNLFSAFQGIVVFDKSFQDYLSEKILRIIAKSLQKVESMVADEIEWQRQIANSNQRMNMRTTTSPGNILIDTI